MKPSLKATQTYLSVALAVAVLPVASILIGAVATKTGLLDWKLGFGLLTFRGPPLLAMLGLATGLVGLVLALIVDAKGLWFKGVLPLVITLAVMGNLIDSTTPGAAGRVMRFADNALRIADPLLRRTRARA